MLKDSRGIHLIHASEYEAAYWIDKGKEIVPDPDYVDGFKLIKLDEDNFLRVYVKHLPKA